MNTNYASDSRIAPSANVNVRMLRAEITRELAAKGKQMAIVSDRELVSLYQQYVSGETGDITPLLGYLGA